jgi:hypothetical protein
MVFTSFPRHQLRAQGRRRGRAGITITSGGSAQQQWQQNSLKYSGLDCQEPVAEKRTDSYELLDFLSRTAVDSENQLLNGTWDPGFATAHRTASGTAAASHSASGAALASIRGRSKDSLSAPPVVALSGSSGACDPVSLLGQLADSIFSASQSASLNDFACGMDFDKIKSIVEWEARDAIAAVGYLSIERLESAHAIDPLEHSEHSGYLAAPAIHAEVSQSVGSQPAGSESAVTQSAVRSDSSQSIESEFELVKTSRQTRTKQAFDFEFAWARTVYSEQTEHTDATESAWQNLPMSVPVPVNDRQPIESALGLGNSHVSSDLEMAERLDLPLSHSQLLEEGASSADSAGAFRSMLKELNEWLSSSQSAIEEASDDLASESVASESATPLEAEGSSSFTDEFDPSLPKLLQAAFEADPLNESRGDFGAGGFWDYRLSPSLVPIEAKRQRPMFRRANGKPINTRTLDNGSRFECYDSGAVVEKDELGKVTQIRGATGGSVSIYYDRDGNPEGFLRTDAKGRSHSIAECDRQGVIVRDATGRIRAAGDALCIDPNGCLSVCRSDGQFWSIDLVRGKHIERRRLADASGVWNIVTAVFAADGFRMTTLFQPVADLPSKDQINSVEDANRVWSNAAVARSSFRFYGRDGSIIQFESEDELMNLSPSHVWAPGTRRVEPIWKNRHQAGTAWESVQEYVSSYLSN